MNPSLGGLPPDAALLPHWIGAISVQWLGPWVGYALAARLPFAAMLALTLALIWYATYHLAKTDAAQPVPFAFGGEADPTDYARALADGALLASVATVGLLQMGHETTPELMQLCLMALFVWAMSAAPSPHWLIPLAVVVSLPSLALSGAPSIAMALGLAALLLCPRSSHTGVRHLWPWLILSLMISAGFSTWTNAWQWRVNLRDSANEWLGFGRLLLWFTWPTGPMMLWTLWRWRDHWTHRHIAIPLIAVSVGMASSAMMGGSDRALLLAIPGMAILAAFSLPTLQRRASAAIDWFSVFFFSVSALAVWVIYLSMQVGIPPKPAINIKRLVPGFEPSFSLWALLFAIAGSLAWIWLVRWRTSRHRHPLWKSLVLPASGVALTWLLLTTLMLPVLDYARSTRPVVERVAKWVPRNACIRAPGLSRTHVAGLEVFGSYVVDARETAVESPTNCRYLLVMTRNFNRGPGPAGWDEISHFRRPVDKQEYFTLYRKHPSAADPVSSPGLRIERLP